MQAINSNNFKTALNRRRNSVEQTIADMTLILTYACYSLVQAGNPKPFELVTSMLPDMFAWEANIITSFPLFKASKLNADKKLDKAALTKKVELHVRAAALTHKAKLEASASARKNKPAPNAPVSESVKTTSSVAKPKADQKRDTSNGPVVQVTNAIIVEGESQALTSEEVRVALEAIAALRASKAETAIAPKRTRKSRTAKAA